MKKIKIKNGLDIPISGKPEELIRPIDKQKIYKIHPFEIRGLGTGYMLADGHEGKCGEGKCGEKGESEGKCGEGKCGEKGKGEGKCGEGKCGEKSESEGKCGEGKCGGKS